MPLPRAPGAERLRTVNVYLVGGRDHWCLVDTGMHSETASQALQAALQEVGLGWKDLEVAAISHFHPDHYGMSALVRERTRAELLAHREDLEHIFRGLWSEEAPEFLVRHGGLLLEKAYRSLFTAAAYRPTVPDRFVRDGEILDLGGRLLEILHTPGHSPGHCCFLLPAERILITQDHLLPKITPHVGLVPWGPPNPLGDYLDSLRKLAEREPRLALPGHGDPFPDPVRRIRQLERHHSYRLLATVDALGRRPQTAMAIVPAIFGNLPPLHRLAALSETLAHLAFAESRGMVTRHQQEGLTLWLRVDPKV